MSSLLFLLVFLLVFKAFMGHLLICFSDGLHFCTMPLWLSGVFAPSVTIRLFDGCSWRALVRAQGGTLKLGLVDLCSHQGEEYVQV